MSARVCSACGEWPEGRCPASENTLHVLPVKERVSPRGSTDAMQARGVRAKHLDYIDALLDALRCGVPVRVLVEWGIPVEDARDAAQRLDGDPEA